MTSFEDSLRVLKKYNSSFLSHEDKERVLEIIQMNDYNIEFGEVDQSLLKEYLRVRRSILPKARGSIPIEKHLEAIRRKGLLLSIKEDAEQLVTLNKYIAYLVEEKKRPVDTLLENLEYSEIYVNEATQQLEREKERKRRCRSLKTILKVLLYVIGGYVIYRVVRIIV